MLRDRTAIAGIANIEYVKDIGRTELETSVEVARGAAADAGLTVGEIDGIFQNSMQTDPPWELAKALALDDLRAWAEVGPGGGAGVSPVVHAATAVAAGQCDVALAYRARNRGSGGRPWASATGRVAGQSAFEAPYGLVSPVQQTAVLAQRYLYEFGAPRDTLARIDVAQREHARHNPDAYFRDPLTVDDVLASRMIADPLHLFDCCPETDAAAAVLVVSAERAADLRRPPVLIAGAAQGLGSRQYPMVQIYRDDPFETPGNRAAASVYRSAGLGPEDVDVAQFYDMFSPLVLYQLEAYGFCKRGEAWQLVQDGQHQLGGELPLNTHGGSLSEVYLHGFNHVLEGVRQIRGSSHRQVRDADVCLVTAALSVPTGALVLRRS